MSNFSHKDFLHLKKLCRIDASPEEEKALLTSLQSVLQQIDELKKVDTTGVASCNYVLRGMMKNKMRSDEVLNDLPRERFLANAPDQIGGMVRVPPVLKPS